MDVQYNLPLADQWFRNPFELEDLLIFDDAMLQAIFTQQRFGVTVQLLARSCHHASESIVHQFACRLLPSQQEHLWSEFCLGCTSQEGEQAQQNLLDALFWELIYWKMPERYEELTEGEDLHPDLFPSLMPRLRGKTVVDVGAGWGRVSLACVDAQVAHITAVEPSPGLLQLLRRNIAKRGIEDMFTTCDGRFEALPLADASVDYALSCSAFTSLDEQGGEVGLAEMKRVTRSGGQVLVLWPRTCDHDWFRDHRFHYVSFAGGADMQVHFRSLSAAFRCADLFYGNKPEVKAHLQTTQRPYLPFSLIGLNPPCDYFWLQK